MIIRQTVNLVTHVIAGVAFGALAVLAMRGCRGWRADARREDWDADYEDRPSRSAASDGSGAARP